VKRTATLLALLVAVALPLSKAYDVVPYKNFIGTQPQGRVGVTQYYRNTLDDITRVSVWVGDASNPAVFDVQIKDSVTGVVVAEKLGQAPGQSWSWLNFDLTPKPDKPVRGRTYKVVVTRPSGAPISFAYDTTNPYTYGCLLVGSIAHGYWDLAARITV